MIKYPVRVEDMSVFGSAYGRDIVDADGFPILFVYGKTTQIEANAIVNALNAMNEFPSQWRKLTYSNEEEAIGDTQNWYREYILKKETK